MDLSSPMAVGFLEEGDSLALTDQGASTTLYDADGAVLVEITFGSGESDRWARTSGDDVLYRVGSYRVNRLAPARETAEPSS